MSAATLPLPPAPDLAPDLDLAPDPIAAINAGTLEEIEQLEARLLKVEQTELPLTHHFMPGCYVREIFMPAGTLVIGHMHKTEHLNIVLTGRARVMFDGRIEEIEAPAIFMSGVNVRKVLLVHEDMRWATIHPTDETDLDRLAALLITKSPSYLQHFEDLKALKADVEARPPLQERTAP